MGTETIEEMLTDTDKTLSVGEEKMKGSTAFEDAETPEFSGICIAKLAADPNIMNRTGRILMTSDLGDEFNITDITGEKVKSIRSISSLLKMAGWRYTSSFIPSF